MVLRTTNPEESFYRVPRQKDGRRASCLKEFSLQEDDVKASTRVFLQHFPDGDVGAVISAKKPPAQSSNRVLFVWLSSWDVIWC